jgi:hypothetical protein
LSKGGGLQAVQEIRRALRVAGAVAFSRSGSPDLGDFEEAMILKTFGDVPEGFDCSRS